MATGPTYKPHLFYDIIGAIIHIKGFIMSLDAIRSHVSDEMERVNHLILSKLAADIPLIDTLSKHIVASGGKRIRPMLLLLTAKAFNYQGDSHILLAAIIEFIHTATLLHDDVVDDSSLRRGQITANSIWGNEASVLVGDFLFSRAFQLMAEVNSLKVISILATASNTIAKGEVLQLINRHDTATGEARYFEVISAKTAKLFSAATQLAAVISNQSPEIEQQMAAFGHHLGLAFQLVDDALDYQGDVSQMGKNIGDDLAEGKPTLPLIYTLAVGNEAEKALIHQAIESDGSAFLPQILQALTRNKAIEYTQQRAQTEVTLACKALEEVTDSPYKTALLALADFTVSRCN
ncbi:MAG: octaprenyl diphosphate synthase [Gammaproteobacteria bacterium]|jgi:octaprenyl-diphosphate synthase|nr:octaprenyl diphosphate synthase [Gammaproteobacteria bacterium]